MKAGALQPSVERALYPVDQLRRAWLLWVQRRPRLSAVLGRTDSRAVALLSLHGLLSFALAIFAPAWSLVLAPLLLGVPHLAADVRYLVLRLAAPRGWLVAAGLFGTSMLVLRVLQPSAALPLGGLAEHVLGGAWLVTAAMSGAVYGRRCGLASMLAFLLAAGLTACALWQPRAFALVLSHGHNLVALLLWGVMFRRSSRLAFAYCSAVALAALCLVVGTGVDTMLAHGAPSAFGLHLYAAADWLAPGVPDPYAIGLAMAFAFLQNIHYALWLYGIPQRFLQREASLSFRMSYRMLVRDFGAGGLMAVAALMLLVAASGVVAPVLTRHWVLSLGSFHAWLELAACLFLLSASSRPGTLLR